MMTSLSVPRDDGAERALAGGVLVHSLTLADLGLDDGAFYDPRLTRVANAADQLGDLPRFYADLAPFLNPSEVLADVVELAYDLPSRHGVVAAAAAFLADESPAWVASLMAEAPLRAQLPSLASRVVDAARRRRLMATSGEVYRRLGEGASLEEAKAMLGEVAA